MKSHKTSCTNANIYICRTEYQAYYNFQCNSLHVHTFEFQNFSNNDYGINDDNDNNTKNDHKSHQQQQQREQEKYFVVDIRLQIMDMAVKSGVYGLVSSGCLFYILILTWRCSSFLLHVSKSFMFLLGPQLHYPCLIFNLLFILREIHPGFRISEFQVFIS